jgi:hypothetical protein
MPISGGFEHSVPTQANVMMLAHSPVPQLTKTAGTGYSAVVAFFSTFAIRQTSRRDLTTWFTRKYTPPSQSVKSSREAILAMIGIIA